MRDKNPPHTQQGSVSLYFYSFNICFFICSLFFKLYTINAGSYRKREERVYAKKVKKVSENLAWISPLSQHCVPREACQCLYCYLICKNGKIVLASVRIATPLPQGVISYWDWPKSQTICLMKILYIYL